jgi:large subunit ribosomal protein L25
MQTIEIKATKRESLGKTATKELRKSGGVPSVIYGGKDVVHFHAAENELRKLINTPNVYLIKLNIDGTVYDAVIKDLQFHPVSDSLLHIDFLHLAEGKPVIIEIPVKLEGLAEGVKAGGKLTLEQRKLRVKGLAKDLPDVLKINISSLGLGKGIQVGALSFPNLELLNAKNSVVVSVKLTRAARAAAQQKG